MDLADKLDRALFGEIKQVSNSEIVLEANFLKSFLGLFPGGGSNKEFQQVRSEPEPESQNVRSEPQPVEKTKTSKAPTVHLKSYAIARGKGYLRVAVEGDTSLTKARLHIFKKGSRYFGFLVVPGPGGARTKREDFDLKVAVILELNIYEAVSDVVLKFDSDDLGELFNLSNYTERSNLPVDKFNDYESDVGVLDLDAAEKADVGRLPWGKQQRDELRQEDPVDIDINALRKLSDRYTKLAEKESDPVIQFIYEFMAEATSKITNRDQIEQVIDNAKDAIGINKERGDERSMKKAMVYEAMLEDFVDAINDLNI